MMWNSGRKVMWPRCRGCRSGALRPRFRPGQRLLEPVVAPEQFARRHEAWRAENAELLGLFGRGAQRILDLGGLRACKRRLRIMTKAADDRRHHGRLANAQPFAELGA